MKVVALEEHYWDAEVARHFKQRGPEMRNPQMLERLHDLGALRLKEMDEAGIDVQVLSHGAPATQRLDAATWRCRSRAAPTTACTKRSSASRRASQASPCCRPPTRRPPPTSSSARSPSSASRAR